MLKMKTPITGKPGAFFDMFFGWGIRSTIEDGLLKLKVKCPLDDDAYERIQCLVKAAQGDDNVKAIFFDVDSPGGYVAECAETAAVIRASTKPTIAYVSGYSASAAYWLTSAMNKIFAHPTAFIGSIGVVNFLPAVEDGVVVVATKSPNKVNLATDAEGVAREKALMDSTYEHFAGQIAAFRGVPVEKVEAEWGKGGLLTAAQALAVGMIDEISDREKALTFALSFTRTPPTDGAQESEPEVLEETAEETAEGEPMGVKAWFASRKSKAEMTEEEKKNSEQITADWVKENEPEVYTAIFQAGKDAAAAEAEKAAKDTEDMAALADEENTDEKALVASLRAGKIKAADFPLALAKARKEPSETERQRRAKAGLRGDTVKIHQGAETGGQRADAQSLGSDIAARIKAARKAGN